MTTPTTAMTSPMPVSPLSPTSLPNGRDALSLLNGADETGFTKDQQKQILSWALESYHKMKMSRAVIERQWYTNLAFFFGRQNITIVSTTASTSGFQLHTPKAPPWRVRLVSNKIRPIIRTELSKLMSQKPTFTVVPATTEDEDQTAARVGEQIFEAAYSGKRVNKTVRRTLWWTLICGTGFVKDYWDGAAVDNDSKQVGDIIFEPVTPFHLFVPDLREEELEQQPYLIHASTKSLDWVKARYKRNLEGRIIKPNVKATDDILEDSFLDLIGVNNRTLDQVLVLEVWIKPNGHPFFPQGGLATIIGGELVQLSGTYPYTHGEFPFTKFDHIPSGKFYADSVIVDLVPLQREYNRTRSQIIEAKNLMAKPKLLAPRGSINAAQVTSEPGQVIFFVPGLGAPTPLPLMPLPAYVLEELNRIQSDIDDIAGQHEITRGNTPAQVTAATAISFLQEQDDSKLSHTVDSIEHAMEKMGKHYLSHVGQFWTTPRTVRVVGMDMSFDAAQYQGSMLRGNTDVRVEAGSALPKSKAARQAFVMDLIKLQVIPPQEALRMLDIGGIDKIYEDYLVDLRQGQRENMKMAAMIPTAVNTWDNHQIHIEVHNKFRKGQQYEAMSVEQKTLFEQHVQMHQMAMGMSNAGLGMPPQGMLPPGGQGGPPPGVVQSQNPPLGAQ